MKAGKLKALAVTSPKRSPLAPDVPTMIEAGLKDFDISAWYMVLAPRGTPPAVVQKLNAEINKAMQDPEVREQARQPRRRLRRRHAGRSTEVHALGDRALGSRCQNHRHERQLSQHAAVRPAFALGHASAATCCRRRKTWRSSNARGDRRRRTTPKSRWRNTFARNNVRTILDFGFTKNMTLDQVRPFHDYAIETQRRFPDVIFGNWLQIDPRTRRRGRRRDRALHRRKRRLHRLLRVRRRDGLRRQ